MKKFKCIILVLLLLFINVFLFSGCSSNYSTPLFVNNCDYRYAIVLHNGVHVLHKIDSLHINSNSASVTFSTTCCFNTIDVSNINCELFFNLPKSCWYDIICECC